MNSLESNFHCSYLLAVSSTNSYPRFVDGAFRRTVGFQRQLTNELEVGGVKPEVAFQIRPPEEAPFAIQAPEWFVLHVEALVTAQAFRQGKGPVAMTASEAAMVAPLVDYAQVSTGECHVAVPAWWTE